MSISGSFFQFQDPFVPSKDFDDKQTVEERVQKSGLSFENWARRFVSSYPQHIWQYGDSLTPVTGILTGRIYSRIPLGLMGLLVSLDTAGTTNTVVEVVKNGNSIGKVILASGVHMNYQTTMAATIEALKDYYQFWVSTSGTGAKGLVAQLFMRV